MDAYSCRLKDDMYSHNFNSLLDGLGMTIIPRSFLKQPPTTTPMFCLSILPSSCPLLLLLASLLVLKNKKQFQITANSMALLHSLATCWKERRVEAWRNHHGLRSGTIRSTAWVLKAGSWTCSWQVNLHWLGEQEGLFYKHHRVWISRG